MQSTKSDTQEREVLHHHGIQDTGSSLEVVGVGGRGFESKDQTEILVGIIT